MNENNEAQDSQEVEVETVERKLEVAKESTEIVDGVHDLIQDIRDGKDVAVIAAENLPNLIQMVDGYDKLSAEMKSKHRNATVGYAGIKIADALS